MTTITISATITSSVIKGGASAQPPVNTIAPVVSGSTSIGSVLSCTTGTWTGTPPITYTYQWARGMSDIPGATSPTYTLVEADAGNNILCQVTATNIAGSSSVSSNALAIPLLLDSYPNAAVAYSVRKLRTAYSGAALRVRRSSDNAESDIGFVANQLDTASLLSFVGYENLAYYSEQFQNAYWIKTNTTVSADATTDPLGGNTADKIQETTTNSFHNVNASGFTATVNNYYTYSAYLKASERTFCNITLSDNATGEVYVVVNLANGTIGSALGVGNWANRSASITSVGNGWYRVSVTAQKTVATVTNAVVNISVMQNSTTFSYAGTTGSGIFAWGAQYVNGTSAGTYQQTTNLNNTANGFVTTWYDQSGNAQNLTQTTAANQPRIVNAGVLETISGKASMQFDGSNDAMYVNFPNIVQPNYYSIVTTKPNSGFRFVFDSSSGGRQVLANSASDTSFDFNAGITISGGNTLTAGIRYLINILANSTNSYVYTNNNLYVNANAGTNGIIDLALGYWITSPNTNNANIKIQEFIIYPSDQSANRTAINTNTNSYYLVWSSGPTWDGSQSGMLNTYSGAAVAYSVRALNSAYTGPLIRVRRSSDNAEIDIFALYNGELDTTFLLNFVGAGNGFVARWYDQSGNGRNATQTTAANQPQIVSAGSLLTLTGVGSAKPILRFDGTNDNFDFSAITAPQFTSFYPQKKNNTNSLGAWIAGTVSGNPYTPVIFRVFGTYISNTTTVTYSSTYNNNNYILMSGYVNSSNAGFIQINNSAITLGSTLSATAGTFSKIGARTSPSPEYSQCDVPEMILYASDNSANISAINTNINNYYQIY